MSAGRPRDQGPMTPFYTDDDQALAAASQVPDYVPSEWSQK